MYNVFVYLLFCSWFFYGEGDQTVTKIAQNSLEVSIIEDIPDPVEHSPEQPDVADPTWAGGKVELDDPQWSPQLKWFYLYV